MGKSYVLCSFLEVNGNIAYDEDCGGSCGELGHCYYKVKNP